MSGSGGKSSQPALNVDPASASTKLNLTGSPTKPRPGSSCLEHRRAKSFKNLNNYEQYIQQVFDKAQPRKASPFQQVKRNQQSLHSSVVHNMSASKNSFLMSEAQRSKSNLLPSQTLSNNMIQARIKELESQILQSAHPSPIPKQCIDYMKRLEGCGIYQTDLAEQLICFRQFEKLMQLQG